MRKTFQREMSRKKDIFKIKSLLKSKVTLGTFRLCHTASASARTRDCELGSLVVDTHLQVPRARVRSTQVFNFTTRATTLSPF